MNISVIEHKKCTGCMACVFSCPIHCISIDRDEEGFLVPKVDREKCIDCGKCLDSCGANRLADFNRYPLKVYAARKSNTEELMKSSSGGVASILAEKVLEQNGVVYGSIMDDALQVRHCRVNCLEHIDKLRGSKYVQSSLISVYESIKDDCESGHGVAFFGTPCQVYAIKKFLKKEYDNLLLVDLICHGVPSPLLFSDYITWKEKKLHGKKILEYRFRDKGRFGWDTVYKLRTENQEESFEATKDPYYFSFIYGQTYRECCYQCRFANVDRVGDVTVGDYWGIDDVHPGCLPKTFLGVSAVLCNTEKGKKSVAAVSEKLFLKESVVEKIALKNSNLVKPAERPSVRDIFYQQVRSRGFGWAEKKMKKDKKYYCEMLKRKIPVSVKRKVKDILKNRGIL